MVVEHRQLLDNAAAFGGRHAWFFQTFEQSATNVEPTTITSEGLGKKPIVGAVLGWQLQEPVVRSPGEWNT